MPMQKSVLTIPELVERHGMDIHKDARRRMGPVHGIERPSTPDDGCCVTAAHLAFDLLATNGYAAEIVGPARIKIVNPTQMMLASRLPDRELTPAEARQFKADQETQGGYTAVILRHFFVLSEGYVVDCALPDWSMPEHQIVLPPLAALVSDNMIYTVNGCGVLYTR